jgi:PHS family inorganic phosphate transporter-like MFS transporter
MLAYRGTFYGMANAGGKVGGIIIRAVIGKTGNQPKTLSIRLLIFIPVMLLAAFISFFLPDVQEEPSRRAVDTEKTSAGSSGTSQDISSDDAAGNPSYHEAHTTLTLPAGRSDDEVSETTISSFGDSRRDIHGSCAAEDRKAWSMFGSLRNRPLEEIAPSPTLHQRGAT